MPSILSPFSVNAYLEYVKSDDAEAIRNLIKNKVSMHDIPLAIDYAVTYMKENAVKAFAETHKIPMRQNNAIINLPKLEKCPIIYRA